MELAQMTVPELRKLGQELKVKDYNKLQRTELVREIRKATTKELTKEDCLNALKSAHATFSEIVAQRQAARTGYTSYMGIREQIRLLINKVEKINL